MRDFVSPLAIFLMEIDCQTKTEEIRHCAYGALIRISREADNIAQWSEHHPAALLRLAQGAIAERGTG